MTPVRIGAVAAHFGRDVGRTLAKLEAMLAGARRDGTDLLVLPGATIGGYVPDLQHPWAAGHSRTPGAQDLPPAFALDDAIVDQVRRLAGPMVICFGFCELEDGLRYNTALAVSGDGVLGRHRKVHQPLGEVAAYAAGDRFAAFDTPVGRMGMLIDYDKTFPESARSLALDGAQVVAALSAWPASVTNRAERLGDDRQARLFDLYDAARAAENQVVWVSSNQTGVFGDLRFLGQAKVVDPAGRALARTGTKGGLAAVELDVAAEVARARRLLHHLVERRPAAYGPVTDADRADADRAEADRAEAARAGADRVDGARR
ncbi:carbon-nitrogen hydrolase family protein [Microlunatus flavus]|uniref:Nitrilase n=1 Tax=Microlunatus flavus TaxID=1036181 RepID=A0A1H9G754_9ACTN|nr:carbon-nitrogen hydrolase family protein [Microlunatus flavus]SEQ46005.1 nitrilase [Microlunatus flavus]